MTWLRRVRHRLAHRLELNVGHVVLMQGNGFWACGFKCDGCGEISEIRPLRPIQAMRLLAKNAEGARREPLPSLSELLKPKTEVKPCR